MSLILSGTDGLSDVDGSAATPAIRGTDTNTGIFFPAADTIAFAEGGVEAMRLDSSGNLGIGTTDPSGYSFDTGVDLVVGNSTNSAISVVSSTTGTGYLAFADGTSGADKYRGLLEYSHTDNFLGFRTNAVERARIDSSGNLLVAGGISSVPWNVTGNVSWGASINSTYGITANNNNTLVAIFNRTNGVGGICEFKYNGATVGSVSTNGTTTTYNTSSDYRLKDVTGSLSGYKERLSLLQPKQGSWKSDGSEFRGFLAHEFAEAYPASVSGEKDAIDEEGNQKYQGMQASSSEVMADLVALVQEQQAIIESLKARLDAANL